MTSQILPFNRQEASNQPPAERITPQSLEAEQSTLGAMMQQRDAIIAVAEIVGADDFYREYNRMIFDAIMALFARGDPADLVTVSEELRRRDQLDVVGGAVYLITLLDACPSAANAEAYARAVADTSLRRRAIQTGTHIINLAYGAAESVEVLVDTAESSVLQLADTRHVSNTVPFSLLIDEECQRIATVEEFPDRALGVDTGFYDLNEITSGWQKTDLIIVAARPSMGKTSIALQFAQTAAETTRLPVVIFSLEMSRNQLTQRMVCAEAGIDGRRLRTVRLTDQEWGNLHESTNYLRTLPLHICDTAGLTTFEMRAQARRVKAREGGLALIVVDYMQLATHTGRHENRVQLISQIGRDFKAMAKELNVPLIALAQLSRAVEQREDKRPILSDLRESGSIEADADVVTFIYRPSYYASKGRSPNSGTDPDANLAEIIVAKQRNGPVGTVRLHFRAECARFYNRSNQPDPGNYYPYNTEWKD